MQSSSVSVHTVRPFPLALRLFMPTVTDMTFILTFYALTFGSWASALLNDADTGWHIRNGEYILQTHSVPHVDYFSYTMSGHPWYAWEWLYDVVIWCIHTRLGLNGVVLFSALVIAATFTLLFRFVLARSGHLLISAGLVLLTAAASTIHFLARPHLLTWLFTVIWFQILDQFQAGRRKHLLWLPVLMLFWVNIHGGFLLGLVLLGLYLVGNLWAYFTTSDAAQRQQARRLAGSIGVALALCLLATLVTPYGYKLHVHVYQYLSNRFFMDHIAEFMAPNFHALAEKYFEGLLLLTIVAVTFSFGKLRAVDVLIILFSTYSALYAARNLPISAILITFVIAPLLGQLVGWAATHSDLVPRVRRLFSFIEGFSKRMAGMEYRLNMHTLPILLIIISLWVGLNGGQLFSEKVLSVQFDAKQFPVKATEVIAERGIRDRLFSTDTWGGYLMYKLYPQLKVFMDDRHDFYGEAFLKDYLKVIGVGLGWKDVLEKHKVNWILVSPESSLSNTLKEMPEWKVIHDDGVAILFARAHPL